MKAGPGPQEQIVEGFLTPVWLIQVAEAKTKAQEAKDKAQAALKKASDTKKKVESSNNDLRDLIKQIRGFLMREFLKTSVLEGLFLIIRNKTKKMLVFM